MGAISRWLSRFSYKHPKFAVPNLMKYIVFGNVLVWVMDLVSSGTFSQLLSFVPAYILSGQVWRLVTFVFVPDTYSPIWFVLSCFIYYFLGTQLENIWGSARFTLFYLLGVILTAISGLLLAVQGGFWLLMPTANMYYVNMSMFLAFASLYPDAQFRIYFFIPIKGKWLAWLYVALIGLDVYRSILARQYLMAFVPLVALFNYLLFFWDDLTARFRKNKPHTKARTTRQTVDFKAAQKHAQQKRGYLHKCSVCGRTDTDNPGLEFRYCSRCNGYYCYCMDHINNHVHIT